jgi:glycosyltransferase involved in cell wall biosynthesis
VTTVIVPAHNESGVIGRLLTRLVPDGATDDLKVIVVANGCTDDTAEVAASFGPAVRVLTLASASKHQALVAGDRAAVGFPRLYVDADVELDRDAVAKVAAALAEPCVLAAAPQRRLALAASPWPVRWYYDVWARLPEVRDGLFGRGVIAVGQSGHERIASLPPLLADDLAASLSFGPAERRIVPDAHVTVHMPRTLGDLLRRRVRAAAGVAQIERSGATPRADARTRPADLAAILRDHPRLAPKMALFLTVAVLSRLRARRAVARKDYTTWLRDESSRRHAAPSAVE